MSATPEQYTRAPLKSGIGEPTSWAGAGRGPAQATASKTSGKRARIARMPGCLPRGGGGKVVSIVARCFARTFRINPPLVRPGRLRGRFRGTAWFPTKLTESRLACERGGRFGSIFASGRPDTPWDPDAIDSTGYLSYNDLI